MSGDKSGALRTHTGIFLKKNTMRYSAALLLLLCTSCTSFHELLVEPDADLVTSQFHRFHWRPPVTGSDSLSVYFPGLSTHQLQSAINAEMDKKGYLLVESPSLLELHYHLIVKDTAVIATPTYDYERLSLWECSTSDGVRYKRGTLIVDMVDLTSGQLIWRSRYVGALSSPDPKKSAYQLKHAIPKMMKSLPHSIGPGGTVAERND